MKHDYNRLLTIILLVLLTIGLAGHTLWFNYRLNEVQSNLTSQIALSQGSLSGDIGNISGNISFALQEQNNLLTENNSRTLSLDTKNQTITVELSIVPKSVTDTLQVDFAYKVDGKAFSVAATRKTNLSYTANINVPVETELIEVQAQLTDKGETKTQNCDSVYQPGSPYFMFSTCSLDSYGFTPPNGTIYVTANSPSIRFNYTATDKTFPVTATVIIEKNDTEVERHDLSAQLPKEHIANATETTSYLNFDCKYSLAENDRLKMYLEVTDSNGLIYKGILADFTRSGEDLKNDSHTDKMSLYTL